MIVCSLKLHNSELYIILQMSYDQKTFFLKIHVPWKALTRYAEVMNLKMPTKVSYFQQGS